MTRICGSSVRTKITVLKKDDDKKRETISNEPLSTPVHAFTWTHLNIMEFEAE